MDLHGFLFRQIYTEIYKTEPVTLGIGVCHGLYFFFLHTVQKTCDLQFAITDILAITIEITGIGQIRMHHDIRKKVQ